MRGSTCSDIGFPGMAHEVHLRSSPARENMAAGVEQFAGEVGEPDLELGEVGDDGVG